VEATADLVVEGTARELVNRIQLLRRAEGLDVTDRIVVRWSSEDDTVAGAFERYAAFISGEVLATAIERDRSLEDFTVDIDGAPVAISVSVA